MDKFIDFILRITEEEILVTSMHQNYYYIDFEQIKNSIKIAIDKKDDIIYTINIEKRKYLQ